MQTRILRCLWAILKNSRSKLVAVERVVFTYPQLLRVWNGWPPGVWRSEVWNGRLTIVDLFHLDHFRPFYAFTCMMMILDLWILRFWNVGLWNFGNLGWILGIWIFWSFRIWILGDLDFGNLDLLRMLWICFFFCNILHGSQWEKSTLIID